MSTARVIKIRETRNNNQVAYAILSPSVDEFVLGGKARLVRCMATPDMKVGSSLKLSEFTVGQTEALPPRTDNRPSHFSDITWLDAVKKA